MSSRTSGRGRAAATARSQSAVPRPAQQSQEKNKDQSQDQDDAGGFALLQPIKLHVLFIIREVTSLVLSFFPDLGVAVSSGLVASVQSLVAVLQQQVDTSGHQPPADSHSASDNVIHCSCVSGSLLS